MVADWFLGLFTISNLAWFLAGVAATLTWQWVRAHMKNRMLVIHWAWMAVPLIVLIVLYVAAQTQQSANCVREFQTALTQRSAITTQNDEISQRQRMLLYQWLRDASHPPPEIEVLHSNDPRRIEYMQSLTERMDTQIVALWTEQERYDRQRAANPLPEPKCGI